MYRDFAFCEDIRLSSGHKGSLIAATSEVSCTPNYQVIGGGEWVWFSIMYMTCTCVM